MARRIGPNPADRTRRYLYGLVAANLAVVVLIVAFFQYHHRIQDRTLEKVVQYHSASIRAAQSALTGLHGVSDQLRLPAMPSEATGTGAADRRSPFERLGILADERELIDDLQRRFADPEFAATTAATVRAFDAVLRIAIEGSREPADLSAHTDALDELALRLRQLTRLHMGARDRLADFGRLDGLSDPANLLASVGVLTAIGLIAGLGIVRNVTETGNEREAALDALRRSETRLGRLAQGLETAQRIAKVGSWEWDVGSDTERWSDQTFRNLGLEPGSCESTVARFYECVHPRDREKCSAAVRRAVAEKSGYEIDFRVVRDDGSVRVMLETAEMMLDEEGNPVTLLGTMQDVTAEREAERESATLASRLSDAQRIARLGNWEWNAETKEEWWSDEIYRIFGLEPGSVTASYDEFNARVHPDDRNRLFASIQRTQSGEAPPYNEIIRIRQPDGSERIVREAGEAQFDAAGELLSLGGTVQDITEQYETEAALRETTRRLEAAQAAARIGIWEWDIATNAEWWSEQQFRNYGLEPADGLVQALRFLRYVHPDDRDRVRAATRVAATTAEPLDLEFRAIGADGIERVLWGFGKPEIGEDDKPVRMVGTTLDITDRKRAEAELQTLAIRLEEAQRIAHVGHWAWLPGKDTSDWSNELFRIFGLEPNGSPPTHEEFLANILHPDDRVPLQSLMEEVIRTGTAYSTEFRIIRPSGEERAVFERAERFVDDQTGLFGIQGIVQDITERKRAEDAVRESEARLDAFFAAAPAGLALYDRLGRYVKINETLAENHGVSVEAHIGKRPSDILPRDFARDLEAGNMRTLEQGERTANREVSAPLPGPQGGEIHYVYSRFPIFAPSGEPSGIGVVTVDITELKTAQRDLSRLNAELEQRVEERTRELRAAQDELVRRERLATLGQLTATVSHELRNPLGAMRTSLYVIEKSVRGEDERMAKAIARINRSITRCDNIIDELLDFTRIRELQFRDLALDSWLEALLDEQASPEGITLRRKLAADGLRIPADPDRLRRAVINVYENACQAMAESDPPRGGHKLTIATRAVGNSLEIIFEDTGPGIAAGSLDRIFEPLFSTKNFGVGLGLPVVRQILEQHGGTIEAGNRKSRGAKFVLRLPRERRREDAGT